MTLIENTTNQLEAVVYIQQGDGYCQTYRVHRLIHVIKNLTKSNMQFMVQATKNDICMAQG